MARPRGEGKANARHSTQLNCSVALTIAGSDSSAGAGIQADLKTFSALGVYGLTAVTCVVAETPGKVARIAPLPPDIVRAQIELLFSSFPIAAAKTGLLCSATIISTVAQSIGEVRRNNPGFALVVDPVMVATSGDQLLPAGAIKTYEKELFPLATLVTPNLDEAEKLLGRKITDLKSMKRAARDFEERYGVAVLLKGGHLKGETAIDLFCQNGKIAEFTAP